MRMPIVWPWNAISRKFRSAFYPKSLVWNSIHDCHTTRNLCTDRTPFRFISRNRQGCPKNWLIGKRYARKSHRWHGPCRDMTRSALYLCFSKRLWERPMKKSTKRKMKVPPKEGKTFRLWWHNWLSTASIRAFPKRKRWNVLFSTITCAVKRCSSASWSRMYMKNKKGSERRAA